MSDDGDHLFDPLIAYIRKRFLWTWLAMALGAIMLAVALGLLVSNTGSIQANTDRLNSAIGTLCAITATVDDEEEAELLDAIANSDMPPRELVSQQNLETCDKIVRRINEAADD